MSVKDYLNNQELMDHILPQIEFCLHNNLDSIKRDMFNAYEQVEATEAFKYPVRLTVTLKPAADASEAKVDVAWTVSKKDTTGFFPLVADRQTDLFDDAEEVEKPKDFEEIYHAEFQEEEEKEEKGWDPDTPVPFPDEEKEDLNDFLPTADPEPVADQVRDYDNDPYSDDEDE